MIPYLLAVLPHCLKLIDEVQIFFDHIHFSYRGLVEENLDPLPPKAPPEESSKALSIRPEAGGVKRFTVRIGDFPAITLSRRLAQILVLLALRDEQTALAGELIAFRSRTRIIELLAALDQPNTLSVGAFNESIRKLRMHLLVAGLPPGLIETMSTKEEPAYRLRIHPTAAISFPDILRLFKGGASTNA